MSEIKALDKLRDKIKLDVNNPWSDLKGDLLEMCDSIEREIQEHYLLLPVDADGVPIHVGDELVFANKGYSGIIQALNTRMVIAMHVDSDYLNYAKYGLLWDSADCRHVKSRTLEDVLCDMIHEYGCTDALTETIADKYAAEIRELLGGDAE